MNAKDLRELCPWCGATNVPRAEFCETCHSRLRREAEVAEPFKPPQQLGGRPASGLRSPQAAAGGGLLPTAGGTLPSFEADRRPIPTSTWLILGVVLAGVLGLGLYLFLGRTSIRIPDAIAGRTLLDEPMVQQSIDQMVREADDLGMDLNAGFYQRGGLPAFMVLAVAGGGNEEAQQIFDGFVAGMESEGDTAVDGASQHTQTRDGVSYICAPVESDLLTRSAAGVPGFSVCQWHDGDTTGFVLSFESDEPSVTLDLTEQVHRAVVR